MEKAYRKFVVWQRAHELAVAVFQETKSFNGSDLRWFASQLRRAAYSVPANFVEGYARGSRKEFLRYLNIAAASLSELEYGLEFGKSVGCFNNEQFESLGRIRSEVGYLLHRFVLSVKQNIST
ncbi:hypothetical protein A2304_00535 [Candidatus Uhrbacteria bacterium RIFOXYB2_FULL_57_15]|uniref:Four helix bundle protein n=1 Tax=Candidatus Uhrbacteria bacterium RIFOXYB2_FULL_57_15 TaxID=1802422 RepID=A0A1F7W6C7_9BACT|nr:MAG: hypothetical protein A2304_00535 [Candidatus Uhrbacteria bacterium RIFOXYB2_FULL_57_15]OGM00560.1 MAG: hypothetical protein A2501_04985 [Candidatus Uhrbacteria bacterium RIFOXYC12_FULL_57_11]